MKFKNLFLGVLACAGLVACSNEDLVDSTKTSASDVPSYVAVKISTPENNSSRAVTNDGFVYGTEAENEVKKATFLLFDGNGNQCCSPIDITSFTWTTKGDGNSIAKETTDAVLVINNKKLQPVKMLTLINYNGTSLSSMSLNQVIALAADYTSTTNGFLMSNSVYKDDKGIYCETPINIENITTDKDEALANPVNVTVERVLAKVQVSSFDATTKHEQTDSKYSVEGVTGNLSVILKGYQVANANDNSYLIKHVNLDYLTTNIWANDASNHRSYWANSADATNYINYTEASISDNTSAVYCQENTKDTYSKLIVTAQVLDAQGNPVELRQYNGKYYTESSLKTLFASYLTDYYKQVGNDYKSLAPEDLELVASTATGAHQYETNVALANENLKVYKNKGTSATPNMEETTLDLTAKFGVINSWRNGLTEYNVDILQHAGVIGIVRNHVYNITINGVYGFGTPIWTPNVITPEDPPVDKSSYMAATVNILEWRTVSQDVNLGK